MANGLLLTGPMKCQTAYTENVSMLLTKMYPRAVVEAVYNGS